MKKISLLTFGFLLVNTYAQVNLPSNIKIIETKTTTATDIYGNQQTIINATPNVAIVTQQPVGEIIENIKQDVIDNNIPQEEIPALDSNNKIITPETAKIDTNTKIEEKAKPKKIAKKTGQIPIYNTVLKTDDISFWNTSTIKEIEEKAQVDLENEYKSFLDNAK